MSGLYQKPYTSSEENVQIKQGEIPEDFKKNPAQLAQQDTDARWTKKNQVSYFGFKNHVKTDARRKLIVKYMVTDASVHDSQALDYLLDKKDKGEAIFADSAYTGQDQEQIIISKEMQNQVCEKGYRNRPLTEAQKASHREKSRVRSRVEHIFGFMENSMQGMYL